MSEQDRQTNERKRLTELLVHGNASESYQAHKALKKLEQKDPQWIPSDAEMINWVTSRSAIVRVEVMDRSGSWKVCDGYLPLIELGHGATWRAAVEDAMRKGNTV